MWKNANNTATCERCVVLLYISNFVLFASYEVMRRKDAIS